MSIYTLHTYLQYHPIIKTLELKISNIYLHTHTHTYAYTRALFVISVQHTLKVWSKGTAYVTRTHSTCIHHARHTHIHTYAVHLIMRLRVSMRLKSHGQKAKLYAATWSPLVFQDTSSQPGPSPMFSLKRVYQGCSRSFSEPAPTVCLSVYRVYRASDCRKRCCVGLCRCCAGDGGWLLSGCW